MFGIVDKVRKTQIWKSIFRHGPPNNARNRAAVVAGNVFLHLHPIKIKKSGIKLGYTWCMGGLTFFIFLALTVTGVLLMFYYRPTAEYAFNDIIALREHVPLGIMREVHRWGGARHGDHCVVAHVSSIYDRLLQASPGI